MTRAWLFANNSLESVFLIGSIINTAESTVSLDNRVKPANYITIAFFLLLLLVASCRVRNIVLERILSRCVAVFLLELDSLGRNDGNQAREDESL